MAAVLAATAAGAAKGGALKNLPLGGAPGRAPERGGPRDPMAPFRGAAQVHVGADSKASRSMLVS